MRPANPWFASRTERLRRRTKGNASGALRVPIGWAYRLGADSLQAMDDTTASSPRPADDVGGRAEASTAPSHPVGRGTPAASPSRRSSPMVITSVVGIVVLVAMQLVVLVGLNGIDRRVDDLSGDVAALEASVSEQIAGIEARASAAPDTARPPTAALPAGYLPLYDPQSPDGALGMQLGPLSGREYYSGTELTVDPADGTRRIWLVWAHWCPYCQQELPEVSAWYPTQDLDGLEVVSVTTSIDPDRGNPLEPYLDGLALPFPVLVDSDLTMARRLGVSAFPFWVVTDGDGTVLLRTAGLLPIEQVQAIADRLAQMP